MTSTKELGKGAIKMSIEDQVYIVQCRPIK